jgi:hypothetical protein
MVKVMIKSMIEIMSIFKMHLNLVWGPDEAITSISLELSSGLFSMQLEDDRSLAREIDYGLDHD